MAYYDKETSDELKDKFKTGDVPTGDDFSGLIGYFDNGLQGMDKGIADGSVTNAKLASKSVSRDKLDFQTPDFTNLFSLSNYVADEYYDLKGTLTKKGESGYLSGFGRTAFIPISNGKVIYRNEKAGYSDDGAVYITFFADNSGQSLVSGQRFGLGSIPVPDGAVCFSMAVHERAKSQVIITIDQPIAYIDSDFAVDFTNLSRVPYTNDQARLVPWSYVPDYLTIDYANEQVIIKKEPGLALWGSNFKWIHGAGSGASAKTDLIYTFAEIRTMTSSEFQYLFIKRVSANTDADRDIFMFTSQNQFTDCLGVETGTRNSIAADYVFVGFFSTKSVSYSFPGTPLKVITKQTDSPVKNISILGDSISTFNGYIPTENATFFPNNFITNVDQTWWKSILDKNAPRLNLLLNNSWSGSRVTNTRTEEQAGYYRALHMGKDGISPDILIIYLGINDFDNDVKLGDYSTDLDTNFPTDGSTFKNAYAMMLDNATKTYPNCKIFTCTLPFSDNQKTGKVVPRNGNNDTLWDFNNAIRDISNQFGTTIIDLAQAGFNRNNAAQVLGDGVLHPNAIGMQLLAKKVNFYLQETLADI